MLSFPLGLPSEHSLIQDGVARHDVSALANAFVGGKLVPLMGVVRC
jgi:hypothetical protein